MAERSNAMSQIVRFWLENRCGCLVKESIPVKVKNNYSDIDLLAMRPDSSAWELPNKVKVARAIVETKDEHDFDKNGKDFGKRLDYDYSQLSDYEYTPENVKVNFSMLRYEHYIKATELFGSKEFFRIFIVHNIDKEKLNKYKDSLADKNIYFFTINEIIHDLKQWYFNECEARSQLRNTLVGDIWHLLVGYCREELTS